MLAGKNILVRTPAFSKRGVKAKKNQRFCIDSLRERGKRRGNREERVRWSGPNGTHDPHPCRHLELRVTTDTTGIRLAFLECVTTTENELEAAVPDTVEEQFCILTFNGELPARVHLDLS
jgi:hypothetical protein